LTDSSFTALVKPNWRESERLKLRRDICYYIIQHEKYHADERGAPDETLATAPIKAIALTALATVAAEAAFAKAGAAICATLHARLRRTTPRPRLVVLGFLLGDADVHNCAFNIDDAELVGLLHLHSVFEVFGTYFVAFAQAAAVLLKFLEH